MQCVLAVDGGNTKTIALVAALDGTILGASRGGCGDIYNADPTPTAPDSGLAAMANVRATILRALHQAQAQPEDIVAAVFNMAGGDWPEDLAYIEAAMRHEGFGRAMLVQNDALGVLYAASPDATGVAIVCGTGAATGARAPDGRVWHSSFWQDEVHGSGHLGQKALFAIYRAELGIEPPTSLTGRILTFLHQETVEDVLHLFNRRQHPPPISVDRLTPLLLDEAHAGDALARRVVRDHGALLGDIGMAAARKVGIEGTPFTLVLAGGVFRHPTSVLADAIIERMRTTSPDLRPAPRTYEPIVGVLFQALDLAGITRDAAMLERVLPTMALTPLFE